MFRGRLATGTSAHLNDINSLTANYEITRTLRSLLESQCEKNQSYCRFLASFLKFTAAVNVLIT